MKEESEEKLNFWKHVSKSIGSFNHEVFTNNNKTSLSAEKRLINNGYVSTPLKKTASKVSPKSIPLLCKPSQNYAYYEAQSWKTYPDYNILNDLKLRTVSVDLSCSHCNFGSNGKDSSRICKNGKCNKYYKNQQFSKKFKLRPLSVVLSDFKTNKTGFDSKDSSDKRAIEKHNIYPGFKSSGEFHNNIIQEELFTSNEQRPYLPELQFSCVANKTPVKNAIIQLHQIDKTIAFCRNLNLQPVWKASKLFKPPIRLKKISKLRKTKSVHQSYKCS